MVKYSCVQNNVHANYHRQAHTRTHHPTHVKRGVVRCLHDRGRGIISTQDNLQKEVDHLARVLKQNGYPANFIRNDNFCSLTPYMSVHASCTPAELRIVLYTPPSALPTQETADVSSPEEEQEEDIRHVCRNGRHSLKKH